MSRIHDALKKAEQARQGSAGAEFQSSVLEAPMPPPTVPPAVRETEMPALAGPSARTASLRTSNDKPNS